MKGGIFTVKLFVLNLILILAFTAGYAIAQEKGVIYSQRKKSMKYPPDIFIFPHGDPVHLLNHKPFTIHILSKVYLPANNDPNKPDLALDKVFLDGVDITDDVMALDDHTYYSVKIMGNDVQEEIKIVLKEITFDPVFTSGELAHDDTTHPLLPEGKYTLRVQVKDQQDSIMEDSVRLIVEEWANRNQP